MAAASDILLDLLRAPSVTPDAAAALDVVEGVLGAAGFEVHRPVFEAADSEPVENMFAAIGSGERHLAFAGHVDVVPPGPEADWRHPPFAGVVEDGIAYGRGAVDMKGGLAAMLAAAVRFAEGRGGAFDGRLSFLVTGDEEGAAVNGTARLVEWTAARGEVFSAAIVGEPTSGERLGDQIKVGRRGSYSARLLVHGRQGHAAYPHLAENPVRGLAHLLGALLAKPLDQGSAYFPPSTLEIVGLQAGTGAWNVIPGLASAHINSRFNDHWTRETLEREIRARLEAAGKSAGYAIRWTLEDGPSAADVFLTQNEELIGVLTLAIEAETGIRPALSTAGGTSDARFLKNYCPVVEFGPVGSSMHQVDECVSLAEIEATSRIYEGILERFFAADD